MRRSLIYAGLLAGLLIIGLALWCVANWDWFLGPFGGG